MNHHSHSHKHLLGTPPPKAEKELRDVMAGVFKKQKDKILQKLPELLKDPKRKVIGEEWNKPVVEAIRPIVLGVYKAGGEKALASIRKFPKRAGRKYSAEGVAKSVVVKGDVDAKKGLITKAKVELPEWLDDPDVLDAIEEEMFEFAHEINQTTADALRDELLDGMEAGETIDQLEERIAGLCDDWADGNRAEMIARTESARAYSKGHIAAWKSTGQVENKVWVAAADACPFCLDMNGTVIPLEDTFMDEGESQDVEWGGKEISMDQDYGDVEGPPLHPNCRCALVGELKENAEEEPEEEKGVRQIMSAVKKSVSASTKFETGSENHQMVEISFALAALIQGMNALCKKIDEVKPSIKYVIVRDKDGLIKEVQEQQVQEQTKKEM